MTMEYLRLGVNIVPEKRQEVTTERGLDSSIKRMRSLMDKARAEAGGARSA